MNLVQIDGARVINLDLVFSAEFAPADKYCKTTSLKLHFAVADGIECSSITVDGDHARHLWALITRNAVNISPKYDHGASVDDIEE